MPTDPAGLVSQLEGARGTKLDPVTGSDETLENAYLMRLAGRFSRRIRGYAKAHDIPVIDCSAGQRKHDLAEEYLAKTTVTQGLFLVRSVGRRRRCGMSAPNTTSNARSRCPQPSLGHALCQPLLVSYPRSRVGPSHHQDQRSSSLSCPGDLERP
jgi:hypothetical protein